MWLSVGFLVTLLTVPATVSLHSALDIAETSCRITKFESAQNTYIYRCISCHGSQNDSFLKLEEDLHRCVGSQLPSYIRSLEAYDMEPLRETNSMNIFHIPAGDAGQPIISRILDMLNTRQPRRHFHKYLFIWPEATEFQLWNLFEGCWRKKLLYALAITQADRVYDFQPFGRAGIELIRVSNGAYYGDKLKDLQGFELRISMFPTPLRALPLTPVETSGFKAIDGSLARLMAKRLNATARYVPPKDNDAYGRCLPNGTFTGVVQDLITGSTHIALNSRFVLDCISPHVEHLYPYNRILIYLVVPAAGMQPVYRIFVTAFQNSVWLILLANFLTVVVLYAILKWILYRNIGKSAICWYNTFETLFKTHLGQPADRFSRTSSIRCFLMGWILFSYVLTSIYFAKLESSFVQPSFHDQINKLDELMPLDLQVHGINNMFEVARLSLSKEHFNLLMKSRRVHSLKDSNHFYELAIGSRNKKAAFIMRDDKAKQLLALTYNPDIGRSTYHIVKQYLASVPATYILPLGSPFRHKFQGMLGAFYEHGFFEYWSRMDVLQRSRASSLPEKLFEELDEQTDFLEDEMESVKWRKKAVVLTLDILQGAFYIWIIGITLSIVGFILEQGYFHRMCK